MRRIEGVEYGAVPGFRPLELDLYLPDGESTAGAVEVPVIVHVHGGGWRLGSRRRPLPRLGADFYPAMVRAGFAVAAIDYRLSGEARYPAAADDVRAAVAGVAEIMASHGVGAGQVFLWGDSAGGHLALLAALTGPAVAGVVAWFPVTDLTAMPDTVDPGTREALFLGAPAADVPDLAREASPISHVRADAPPMLIMHGDSDTLVATTQSVDFAAALTAAGGSAELVLVPGASHFWDGAEDVAALHRRSLDFLRKIVES
ncbi:acetyl esterase/lipase [Actinocorallia herbida]|uniref:Acetyl esterase/lipase n=1 Tax=Actinocorallia herbida TaxID=58109 RepID=A0A3N1D271_9ACTN|nr:alpha/beta hydrolase [Actinocorallia herbida]ROO87634.1 acetyl esterase/lipase [Actinocorallia herbida]